MDLPVIESFPATSEDEWRLYPSYGLRTADAYLLVYDVTNPASFSFIQMIRSSIAQISTLDNRAVAKFHSARRRPLLGPSPY